MVKSANHGGIEIAELILVVADILLVAVWHLKRVMDTLEGEVGEPWLHVVSSSPRLSGLLLGLEYGLGALDKQVGRVLALNLWPSQNVLVESEVVSAILAVLVIVLDGD